MKAHADLQGRFDAVVQPAAVGVEVQVVAAGGAAADQQLGHGHLGRHPHHLGRQAGPDGVERAQPGEELGVLRGRYRPRQALVHVVVRVDQAGDDDVAARVDHVGRLGQQGGVEVSRGAAGQDARTLDEHAGVAPFGAGVVHGGDAVGVFDEQGGGRVHAGAGRRLRRCAAAAAPPPRWR